MLRYVLSRLRRCRWRRAERNRSRRQSVASRDYSAVNLCRHRRSRSARPRHGRRTVEIASIRHCPTSVVYHNDNVIFVFTHDNFFRITKLYRVDDRARSYDASAAAFVRHPLQMFSVPVLPWRAERRNERTDEWRCLCRLLKDVAYNSLYEWKKCCKILNIFIWNL